MPAKKTNPFGHSFCALPTGGRRRARSAPCGSVARCQRHENGDLMGDPGTATHWPLNPGRDLGPPPTLRLPPPPHPPVALSGRFSEEPSTSKHKARLSQVGREQSG